MPSRLSSLRSLALFPEAVTHPQSARPLYPASCFSFTEFHFPGRTKNLPISGIVKIPGKKLLSSLGREEQRSVPLHSTM